MKYNKLRSVKKIYHHIVTAVTAVVLYTVQRKHVEQN